MPRLTSAGPWTRLAVGVAVLALALTLLALPARPAQAADDVLRYLGGELKTLDPAFISDARDVQLLLQLYAGLTRLDENGEPYPSLAESWTLSDDGRTYTFTLRTACSSRTASPLRAEDVRRSWLRILDPATGSTAPGRAQRHPRRADERLAGGPEDAVGIQAPGCRPRSSSSCATRPATSRPSPPRPPRSWSRPTADASRDWQTVDELRRLRPVRRRRASTTTRWSLVANRRSTWPVRRRSPRSTG